MRESHYFIGVDGGGTGCRARLTDARGRVLGEGAAGPANLGLGLDVATAAVMGATRQALASAGLSQDQMKRTHAGLGMAAANVPKHRDLLERARLPFLSVAIASDAETACLGAHEGSDGGILILGTGSQGVVCIEGQFTSIGGWGFALSDSGSGAILGRATVRRAVLAHEGIEAPSGLTGEVMHRFDTNLAAMLDWSETARPRDWAEFARMVFSFAAKGDQVALELVQENVSAAERLLDRIIGLGVAHIALMGGLALPTKSFLSARFHPVLVEPVGDAMDGALFLSRGAQDRPFPASEEANGRIVAPSATT